LVALKRILVLDKLKPEDSGKFWSYDGTNIPW
jgi:hypothetical protein